MKCKDIMSKKIKWCKPDSTVKEAVKIMKQQNCGAVPVVDDEMHLKGIVTDRDITLFVVFQEKDPEETKLKEFMSKDVITCQYDQDLDDLIKKMKKYQIRRIPIVDEQKKLLGMISLGDIAVKSHEERETFETLERISKPIHR